MRGKLRGWQRQSLGVDVAILLTFFERLSVCAAREVSKSRKRFDLLSQARPTRVRTMSSRGQRFLRTSVGATLLFPRLLPLTAIGPHSGPYVVGLGPSPQRADFVGERLGAALVVGRIVGQIFAESTVGLGQGVVGHRRKNVV